METIARKWGNSIGIRIPKLLANELKIDDGVRIEMKIQNGRIYLKPKKNTLQLDKLLLQVSDDNIHKEISSGKPMGNEIW